MITLKGLAVELQLHPRTVKRWWKRLGVPPTIPGHASHRWSERDAERFKRRLAEYWKAACNGKNHKEGNSARR